MNFRTKAVKSLVAAGLILTMTTGIAFASIGSGTVTASSLRLRSEANTTSETITMAAKGDAVDVLEKLDNGWFKVTYNGTEGYMSGEWLNVTLESGEVIEAGEPLKGRVNTAALNVRAGAGTTYDRIGSLSSGTVVTVLENCGNGWYKVSTDKVTGYVSAEYVTLVDESTAAASGVGASAAALAAQLVGCRYVYGAAGPNSFDCSGLLYYIYKQLGYNIARGSSSQYYQSGYFVPVSEMQPGDLIFFFDRRFDSSGGTLPTTHAGIYVGNGQFIHASTTSYRVQYDSIYGYYAPYIVAAKRIA